LLNINHASDPVEITLPEDGSLNIGVAPASARYLEADMHPAYQNSTIVSKAVAASRLIITTSEYVSKTLQVQAKEFTRTTKPNAEPLSFTPTTRDRIRKVHNFSAGAAGLSAKTVSQVSKYAQNIGASLAKHGQKGGRGIGPDGKPIEGFQPGLLNKSMMAFSTIADGIDYAGRNLLASSSTAATTVVTHKYGPEAGEITKSIGGGMKNVALVYIDAAGVSRRAIVKSVVKGMTVGRVSGGGGDVIVPDTDDGVVSPVPSAIDKKKNWKEREAAEGRYTDDASMSGGKASLPAYGSSIGDNIEGQKFSIDSKVIYK
jgi:spartin